MIGVRLKKAKHIAKKRFEHLYILHPPRFWMKDIEYDMAGKRVGLLRKTNRVNHLRKNINPRSCGFFKGKARLTIQERKAPTVEEFDLLGEDNSQFYYDPDGAYEEQYWKDVEYMMMDEIIKAEQETDDYDWDHMWPMEADMDHGQTKEGA